MRQVFSTPRLAEFASMQGLTSRVGLHPDWWAQAVVKELLDNVLDAAETAGLAPVARVTIAEDSITVDDEGPGIDPDVVGRIFDYDHQTSSREAYVEPTRGAQGNALQTILAMPLVLSGGERGELVIESRNVRHDLAFTSDPITGLPAIEHSRAPSDVSLGTRISVKWLQALGAGPKVIAEQFTAFNPHLTIMVNGRTFAASDETWTRWTPNRPPVAHWYNPTTFKRLVQAYASGGEPMTVGAFVREFAGLTGTQKAASIVTPWAFPG